MNNFQVYKKTLSFSFVMFLIDLLALAIVAGCAVAGFFIMNRSTNMALIGLGVGLLIGIIAAALIGFFITNRIKAGQIAMMTKGVTEDKLPDHVYHEGMQEVKGRFAKIALFFFVVGAIKGIFRQLGRALNHLGTAIGGSTGNAVTSAVDSAVQTLLAYLADCCLGWVLYRKDINSARAACEGAAIFFKHGKTLARNVGRIFGMGILSLLLVGGAFFGLSYFIFTRIPQAFDALVNEIAEIGVRYSVEIPAFLTNPATSMLIIAAAVGIAMWGILHSVLIRPFILVGVLRNFMAAGIKDIPTEEDLAALDAKSNRFAKLRQKSI